MHSTLSAASPAPAPESGRAPAGDIPVRDWQGGPLDCAGCAHHALTLQGGCEPGHCCMQDAYARRIDRFFRRHPALAGQHLAHPYFEVRAIAARYADLFLLPRLRQDPDETVRLQVALRLPQGQLLALCQDPHREVRIRVAQRLDLAELGRLRHDPDYEVRTVVARRLPLALLPGLSRDPDEQVRRTVAARLEMPALWRLAADPAPAVRRLVARRAPLPLLPALAGDADWAVRWEVADRLDPATQREPLQHLATHDEDAEVRLRAAERLTETPPAAPAALAPRS